MRCHSKVLIWGNNPSRLFPARRCRLGTKGERLTVHTRSTWTTSSAAGTGRIPARWVNIFKINMITMTPWDCSCPLINTLNIFFNFPFLLSFITDFRAEVFPRPRAVLSRWRCSSETTLFTVSSQNSAINSFFFQAYWEKETGQESSKWVNVKIFTCIVWIINFAFKLLSGYDCAIKTLDVCDCCQKNKQCSLESLLPSFPPLPGPEPSGK